ncbi:DUF4124 domain-containing protein [Microbulbifer sp. YPW1]|uniref:DUF4124 domain-containing protein n=1 Tax=Microbulbifer sp. YPW1 TaxID=2745199 RepID=UPI0015975800|nr:DUF4124 domain-containing protein [Microbulbifer sp. YPW1]QKX17368.1 DUF4124 domain-containing protein [Microbulbifer sp. YPW1]
MRTVIATLFLSLGLMAATAQADGIYKWVDEDGVVHFTSQPPQKKQVEVVKAPRSERYKKWQEEQQALVAQRKMSTAGKPNEEASSVAPQQSSRDDAEKKAENVATEKAEMAARAQRCRSAQQRLQELESHARVREVDASGGYRVLPEEERQQRIQQTRQILQNNC